MKINKAYKFRLYPTNEQGMLINKTFGCTRFVYNYYLNKKQELYKNENKSISVHDCIKDLKNLYIEYPFLKQVDSMPLRCALFDLDNASQKLEIFKKDLYSEILKLKLLYWDDAVIMINTKRACLRFYGNEKIAYYTAHNHKNEEGIKEDNILNILSNNITVMHDHNIINYKYSHQNIECNIHLIRDIEKCKNNAHHDWCDKLKQLIQKVIHDRKQFLMNGCFCDEYI